MLTLNKVTKVRNVNNKKNKCDKILKGHSRHVYEHSDVIITENCR